MEFYDKILDLLDGMLDCAIDETWFEMNMTGYDKELAHLKGIVLELKERGIYIVSKHEKQVL